MNRHSIEKWCKQNNWTEPRELAEGGWVAFSPGGAIETPLPIEAKLAAQNRSHYFPDFFYSLILILLGITAAAIALIISPLFLPTIIKKYKQRNLP